MQKKLKSILILASFLLVFTTVFSPVSFAKDTTQANDSLSSDYDKRVNQLEEAFKFIGEKATKRDEQGNIIGIDIDKIESKYGKSEALEKLKNELKENNTESNSDVIQTASWWGCMKSSLIDYFGVNAVQAAINGGIANYIKRKAWKEAAKLAAKYFVGSSAAGLVATFTYFSTKCTFTGSIDRDKNVA